MIKLHNQENVLKRYNYANECIKSYAIADPSVSYRDMDSVFEVLGGINPFFTDSEKIAIKALADGNGLRATVFMVVDRVDRVFCKKILEDNSFASTRSRMLIELVANLHRAKAEAIVKQANILWQFICIIVMEYKKIRELNPASLEVDKNEAICIDIALHIKNFFVKRVRTSKVAYNYVQIFLSYIFSDDFSKNMVCHRKTAHMLRVQDQLHAVADKYIGIRAVLFDICNALAMIKYLIACNATGTNLLKLIELKLSNDRHIEYLKKSGVLSNHITIKIAKMGTINKKIIALLQAKSASATPLDDAYMNTIKNCDAKSAYAVSRHIYGSKSAIKIYRNRQNQLLQNRLQDIHYMKKFQLPTSVNRQLDYLSGLLQVKKELCETETMLVNEESNLDAVTTMHRKFLQTQLIYEEMLSKTDRSTSIKSLMQIKKSICHMRAKCEKQIVEQDKIATHCFDLAKKIDQLKKKESALIALY